MENKDKRSEKRLTTVDPSRQAGLKNPPVKTDAVTKEQRVSMIAEMLIQGARRSQVNAYLAKKTSWHPDSAGNDPGKVSQRTIDKYMQEARGKIVESANKHREYLLSQALMQLDDLYYKSMKIQDYRNCRQIIRNRNELMGFLRIEASMTKTVQKVDLTKFSKDELIEIMRAGREVSGDQVRTTEDIEFEEMPSPDNKSAPGDDA